MKGLVVSDKTVRVQRFQQKTVHAAMEIIAAAGATTPSGERHYHASPRWFSRKRGLCINSHELMSIAPADGRALMGSITRWGMCRETCSIGYCGPSVARFSTLGTLRENALRQFVSLSQVNTVSRGRSVGMAVGVYTAVQCTGFTAP